jgi:hypothetical protein
MRFMSLCVCALLLTAPAAFAQFDSATVLGTVRDTSNAVVPAAKVTLTAVKPRKYVVTAEKSGFAIALVDNVQVQLGFKLLW